MVAAEAALSACSTSAVGSTVGAAAAGTSATAGTGVVAGASAASGEAAIGSAAGAGAAATTGAGAAARGAGASATAAWAGCALFSSAPSRAISSAKSGFPSLPVCSMVASVRRVASTRASSALVISGVAVSSPSRSSESKFSPVWVTDASRWKPRKPQVPLMVWMARKMVRIASGPARPASNATISRSIWSSSSPLSTRNSVTTSSMGLPRLERWSAAQRDRPGGRRQRRERRSPGRKELVGWKPGRLEEEVFRKGEA